jgi:hypothetical protein
MIKEMSGPGSTAAENDSMKEASSRILDAFGLRPGSQYSGGATCFSAAPWASSNIRGSVTRYNNKKYEIATPVSIERNRHLSRNWRRSSRHFCQGSLEGGSGFFYRAAQRWRNSAWLVAHHWLLRGTDTGPRADGSEPTGRTFSLKGASLFRLKEIRFARTNATLIGRRWISSLSRIDKSEL